MLAFWASKIRKALNIGSQSSECIASYIPISAAGTAKVSLFVNLFGIKLIF